MDLGTMARQLAELLKTPPPPGGYVRPSSWDSGGGGLFGDVGNFFASIDPSTAVSRELTKIVEPVTKPVEQAVTAGVSDVSKALSTDDAKKAMAIAAAYFLPGVGAQLGQALVTQGLITGAAVPYATAIGTALASTGASVAQGVPFDTALTNATVNAVTSTGSQSVAGYISKLGASPEVANAITSVGASGLATAAKGGSAADIERNMTGALAGSAVTGLTGDKISGAVVGGQVTGGTTGALLGAAGAAGAGKDVREEAAAIEKEQDATSIVPPAKPNVVSTAEQDIRNLMANVSPGVQTADMSGGIIAMPTGVRDETAEKLKINLPRIGSDMTIVDPETKGTLRETIVTPASEQPITFQQGQPNLPELDRTGEGLVILSDKAATGGGSSVSPADQAVIDLTGIGGANVGGNVVVGSGADAGAGNAAGNVVVADAGGGNAAGNVVVGPGDGGGGPGGNVTIDAGGGGGNATGNVVVGTGTGDGGGPGTGTGTGTGLGTGTGDGTGTGTGDGTGPGDDIVKDTPPGDEDTKVVDDDTTDDTYTPDVFIYGGVSPKTKTRTTTNLGTTLQAPFYPSTTLGQALTGYRGAGEIEGKKTGKPRQNVWNEESLRLKDALGL